MPPVAPTLCRSLAALLLIACGTALPAQSEPGASAAPAATSAAAPGRAAALPVPPHAAERPTLLVDGLLNSGFEWIADGTVDPPKRGAYWLGAFGRTADDLATYVVEDRPWRGEAALRVSAATTDVLQKVVADPRFTDSLVVTASVRCARHGHLVLTLEDGAGRRTAVRIESDVGVLGAIDEHDVPVPLIESLDTPIDEGNTGWHRLSFDFGPLFAAQHGGPPTPRLQLHVACEGPGRAMADVDELTLGVRWPTPDEADLRRWIGDLVRWTLDTWYLPPERGGLQLVDPATGYATVTSFDVVTGARGEPEKSVGLHTIHALLLHWLEEAHRTVAAAGGSDAYAQAEIARWTPELRRIVATLLAHDFDPGTGLPRTVAWPGLQPNDDSAVTIDMYVEFLLDARPLLGDEALSAACLAQARRTADGLIALQQQHDIPPDRAPRLPVWDGKEGRLVGDTSNWFGFLPDRLTPRGGIETDKRFYTSWAILTGRTFWYEMMSSPRAIMRVHAEQPGPGDLAAVHRVVARFHRDWDASRYDLENDTDDHYGHLAADLLDGLQHARGEWPDALALLQAATDHRLPRDAASAGETLWVQGARLGTACAGDSPRAFEGPLGLSELPRELNPVSSGLPLYRDALLELAQNDLKGRQLTNGQFTESFFKFWEMVCICFKGTYQGDCRDQPADYWQGDVGDTFGGPPTSAIDAQTTALRVAPPSRRPQILAALELIRHATDSTLQRRYGYLLGLDEAVARQYELPAKYTIGLSSTSPAGLGYVMAWMRLMPHLSPAATPTAPRAVLVAGEGATPVLRITGPAGATVALPTAAHAFSAPLSDTDGRMLAIDAADLTGGVAAARRVVLAGGQADVPFSDLPADAVVAQPLLVDPANGEVLAIGEAVKLR